MVIEVIIRWRTGWPDFACEVPVTDPQYKPFDQPQTQFLIANHPAEALPSPISKP
jgi:hypothetical protein